MKKLAWDSEFFELEIFQAESIELEHVSMPKHADLIYVFGNAKSCISGFSKSYEEEKVVFSKTLQAEFLSSDEAIVSIKNKELDLNPILELAYQSGQFSRFNLDPKFRRETFFKLYNAWVYNSVYSNFATDILVYQENEKVFGFVSYTIKDGYGEIGLIAVSQNYRSKGIGRKLLSYVENQLLKNNIYILRIPTQSANENACFFYEKVGYKIYTKTNISHFWNNEYTV